jgi:hypothetical protein
MNTAAAAEGCIGRFLFAIHAFGGLTRQSMPRSLRERRQMDCPRYQRNHVAARLRGALPAQIHRPAVSAFLLPAREWAYQIWPEAAELI